MHGLTPTLTPHPMKILILNSEYPPIGGGAATATANLARYLADQGQDVKVVTVQFENLPATEQISGFEVLRIPAWRERADRSSAGEQISFMLASLKYCITHFHQWKPDACLAFFGIPNGITAMLLKWIYKIPYIVSLRGGDVPGFRPYDFKRYHRLGAPIIKMVWRQSSGVVANSQGLRKLALNFFQRIPILTIPNGVDLEFYKPSARQWSPPHLLFIGRIVYQKGLDLLVEALSHVMHLDWDLTIVGDGSFKEFLLSKVDSLNLNERINFLGWHQKVELLPLLAKSNIFVNPSRHEGMPNAVLEAMACGLPIIASRIAGNEELITHRENGLIFEAENIAGLEAALKELLTNPELCAKMGRLSRRKVEEHFSWEGSGKQYLTLLHKSVERD